MKRFGSVLLLLIPVLMVNKSAAQTVLLKTNETPAIDITGSVQTKQGDLLHLAFVQDKYDKNGVYTDSLGNFGLSVNANSQLKVSCKGFKDTLINVSGRRSFLVVLSAISADQSRIPAVASINNNINIATMRDEVTLNEPSVPNTIRKGKIANGGPAYELTSGVGVDAAQGAIYPVFNHVEETRGSRYLFKGWVHGYVVNNKDSLVQNPAFFFDYDKMGGSLLLTKDKHAAIEIYKELIKSFTLFDDLNQPFTFTIVPEIDKTHFVQVIASGKNYKIYKLTKTKFIAANYVTDGLTSTGNHYDEYQDEDTYFVQEAKTNQVQKLALRKKAIKQAFSGEQARVDKYFAGNDGDIDDNFLRNLGDYMNK